MAESQFAGVLRQSRARSEVREALGQGLDLDEVGRLWREGGAHSAAPCVAEVVRPSGDEGGEVLAIPGVEADVAQVRELDGRVEAAREPPEDACAAAGTA